MRVRPLSCTQGVESCKAVQCTGRQDAGVVTTAASIAPVWKAQSLAKAGGLLGLDLTKGEVQAEWAYGAYGDLSF